MVEVGSAPGVSLRPAGPHDGPAMARVFGAARAGMRYLPVLHTAADDVEYFSVLVLPDSWVMLAVADQGPTGSTHGDVVAMCAVRDGWLNHLYVTPQLQRRGVGSALLGRAMADHPDGLLLWVFEENFGARSLYARAGFVEVERTDGSGNEEGQPDVKMQWGSPLDPTPVHTRIAQ
jgi:ribosomal protein S18 acetylase RimI-like enzyme